MSATPIFPTTRTVASPAPFAVRRLGERLAIVQAPDQLDEATAKRFSRAVLELCDDDVRELVIDLSDVRAHARHAVDALCELEAHLTEACCDPVAVIAAPPLEQDLRAAGLDRSWTLASSVDAALAELLARPLAA